MARATKIEGATLVATIFFTGLAYGGEPIAGHGDAEAPRFRLAYSAPAGCPDRHEFVSAIRERTTRPRLVDDDDTAAIALRVDVEAKREGASGRLELREPDGTEETRSVVSRTCAEVTSALALVAAVMLDPEARAGGGPAEPPKIEPPAPFVPMPPSVPTPPVRAPELPRARPIAPRVPPPPERRWRFAAGAELGIFGGIGPAVAPMAGVFGDVERRWSSGLVSSLRLSFDFATTSSKLRSGSQTYEWLGATLELCPAYVSLPARLRAAPCAGMQAAGHRGTTRDVRSPSTNVQLWLAPTLGGTLEWALSSAVSLELDGGVLFPLRRARFFLAPNSTIFEVPTASGTLGAGVRVRFL